MKHFALVLFLLATSASAQDLLTWTSTGNDLIAVCKDGDVEPGNVKTIMHGTNCLGFILGVAQSHPNLCIPVGVTQTQVVKMVYAYGDKDPKHLNLLAEYIVYSAIVDAFGKSREGTVCKN